MAFNYPKARLTAERLIKNFGSANQVIKKGTKGGYDSSGNVTADVPDVVIDGTVTPLLNYNSHEVDGVNILASDMNAFFHSEIAPEIGMQITVNGVTFRIVSIYSLGSADAVSVNVFRQLQLRG